MRKGSNWCSTYRTLRTDKDIKRLHKKIVEKSENILIIFINTVLLAVLIFQLMK